MMTAGLPLRAANPDPIYRLLAVADRQLFLTKEGKESPCVPVELQNLAPHSRAAHVFLIIAHMTDRPQQGVGASSRWSSDELLTRSSIPDLAAQMRRESRSARFVARRFWFAACRGASSMLLDLGIING